MYGRKKSTPTAPASPAPPKDALAALMEGETPDQEALRFPTERPGYSERESRGRGSSSSNRFEEYSGDHSFDYNRSSANGDYQPGQQGGALNSVKAGAVKSGAFVKDKSVASANYLKAKDWSKEKELAGKAGTATKSGAIYVGSGVAKGAGWLWSSGKSGVESLRKPK